MTAQGLWSWRLKSYLPKLVNAVDTFTKALPSSSLEILKNKNGSLFAWNSTDHVLPEAEAWFRSEEGKDGEKDTTPHPTLFIMTNRARRWWERDWVTEQAPCLPALPCALRGDPSICDSISQTYFLSLAWAPQSQSLGFPPCVPSPWHRTWHVVGLSKYLSDDCIDGRLLWQTEVKSTETSMAETPTETPFKSQLSSPVFGLECYWTIHHKIVREAWVQISVFVVRLFSAFSETASVNNQAEAFYKTT